MFISVIIATRNRAPALARTLESILTVANCEAADWELIVADNGSSDNTAEVLQTLARRFPGRLWPLLELAAGKTRALNAGIAVARGDVLAMTDDDVIVEPEYLSAIREVFTNYRVDAVLGRVILDLEGPRPPWFNDYFARLMSWRDLGDEVCEFQEGITGSNMLVRASVIRDIGGFSTDIGPGRIGTFEDSEFHRRLRRAGYRSLYAPQISVRHQVSMARLTPGYFARRALADGRSQAFIEPLPGRLWRFAAYIVKDLVAGYLTALWYTATKQPGRAVQRRCEALQRAGFLLQHCRFGRNGPPKLNVPEIAMHGSRHAT